MNKVTQSNASNSEESAAAAQELNAQSMTVRELVNKLRRMVDGGVEQPRGSARNQGEDRRPGILHPCREAQGAYARLPAPPEGAFSMEAEEAGSFRELLAFKFDGRGSVAPTKAQTSYEIANHRN